MSPLRSIRLSGALVAAALTLALSVAASPPAGAAAARPGAGSVSLPAGGAACPSTAARPSSRSASCEGVASRAAASRTTVGLPAGAAGCVSTAAKPSSATAACAGAAARPAVAPADTAFSVKLVGSQVSLLPGGTTTLTATSNQDVSPTPFFIQVFDATAGTLLATCGSGTSCATTVTQSGSTVRNYVAYVAEAGKVFPPPSPQATSSPLLVSWLGIGLSASAVALQPGGTTTLTATATLDVSTTPFFIEIFDTRSGTLVAECGFGATCSTNVTQTGSAVLFYEAFVSDQSSVFPPVDVRATSPSVVVSWLSVTLGVSPTSLGAGSAATVVGTASLDVGPTPFFIEMFDETNGTLIAECGTGTVCVGTVAEANPSRDLLIAYISDFSTTAPPPDIRATSDQQPVTWIRTSEPVPNLIGMREADAVSLIEATNLVPSVSHQRTCSDPGDVIAQNPLAGNVVPIGSTVHITVDSATNPC